MLERYRTTGGVTTKVDDLEEGTWVKLVSPTADEADEISHVLGIDCDPQGNLTNVQKDYLVDGCASTDELFYGNGIVTRPDGQATTIAYEELDLLRNGGGLDEFSLRNTLEREISKHGFDACVIDTHPDKSFCVLSALLAATHVIIPTRPTGNDLTGVQMMVGYLNDLAQTYGKDWIGKIGSVVTICRRTKFADGITAQIKDVFPKQGIKVFEPVIHQYQEVDTAQSEGRSLFREGAVMRNAAGEYRWLAKEVGSWLGL